MKTPITAFTVIMLAILTSTVFGQLNMSKLESLVETSETPWKIETLDQIKAPKDVTKFIVSRYRDDFLTFLIETKSNKKKVKLLLIELNWLRMPGASIQVAKETILIAMEKGKPKFINASWCVPHDTDPELNEPFKPTEWFYPNYETLLSDLPPEIQKYFSFEVKKAIQAETIKQLALFEQKPTKSLVGQ